MKKEAFKLTTVLVMTVVMLIMLLAFARTEVFAGSYRTDLSPYAGQERVLSFGTTYDAEAVTYYQIKPTKTGIITFSSDYSGYTVLCNSNGDAISYGYGSNGDWLYKDSSYAYNRTISYGVKAGVTYYVRMDGFPSTKDSSGNYSATVKWTNGKIAAAKSGKKRTKAKAIKRKKTIKGLFVAGDKKAKWYKITSKQKKTTIFFKAPKTDDEFNMTVYYKKNITKGKMVHSYKMSALRSGNTVKYTLTQIGAKKKYTAYVKITRANKASGYYTLKWK